jgi:hypothetical protein
MPDADAGTDRQASKLDERSAIFKDPPFVDALVSLVREALNRRGALHTITSIIGR